jgi:tetratricopeptide (TPR) repeat protein
MKAGALPNAVELFESSIAAAPHFKAFELLGECLLKLGRPLEAVGPLAAATALNDQVRAPSLLAEAFLEVGDAEAARRFAERVVFSDPGNRRAKRVLKSLEAASLR